MRLDSRGNSGSLATGLEAAKAARPCVDSLGS